MGLAAYSTYDSYQSAQLDKTVTRPLAPSLEDPLTLAPLAELDPVDADESLRIVTATHRLDRHHFAISLWLEQQGGRQRGRGQIVIVARDRHTKRRFDIPAETLRALLAEWDRLAIGYHGSRWWFVDGNALSFERRSGRAVLSGGGNNPCHYDRLGDLAARRLGTLVPELTELRVPDQQWHDLRHLCAASRWERMWHGLSI